MKGIKGKKGFVEDLLYWIPKLIYYNIVVLVIILIIVSFVKTKVEMQDAEARLYANRILYSMDSMSYQDDELGRVYPGIIDIARFNEETINKSMWFNNPEEKDDTYIAMNLSLKYKSGKEAVAYYNKKWYKRFLPREGKKGRGGAKGLIEKRFVLVRDENGKLEPAILTIRVLMPNE